MTVDKWEQRMLCPDGACVGVISMNGTCRVCGKAVPDWGDPRKPGRVSSKAEADEHEHEPEPEDEDVDDEKKPPTNGKAVAEPEPNEDDITKRKLCADGACVGVIGADGKCKVCRKAADGSKSEQDDEYEDDEDDDEYEDDEYEDDDSDDAVKADADSGKADGDQAKKADGAKADAKKADDDDNRALCSDGACVGVIGDDGTCKVCGKAAG